MKELKKLKDFEDENVKYPPEMKTARKAEFTTMVKTNQKKPGCRDILGGLLVIILSLIVLLS